MPEHFIQVRPAADGDKDALPLLVNLRYVDMIGRVKDGPGKGNIFFSSDAAEMPTWETWEELLAKIKLGASA